jgi:hypothetical protein
MASGCRTRPLHEPRRAGGADRAVGRDPSGWQYPGGLLESRRDRIHARSFLEYREVRLGYARLWSGGTDERRLCPIRPSDAGINSNTGPCGNLRSLRGRVAGTPRAPAQTAPHIESGSQPPCLQGGYISGESAVPAKCGPPCGCGASAQITSFRSCLNTFWHWQAGRGCPFPRPAFF